MARALAAALALVWALFNASACTSLQGARQQSGPCAGITSFRYSLRDLEMFLWKPDPAVTDFGYRPEHIGLGGDHITRSVARANPNGTLVLDLTYDRTGAAILKKYSTAAADSAPDGTDAQSRHIAWFLNLKDSQIQSWQLPDVRDRAMKPPTSGGNLILDPYVTSPISNGAVELYGGTHGLNAATACALVR